MLFCVTSGLQSTYLFSPSDYLLVMMTKKMEMGMRVCDHQMSSAVHACLNHGSCHDPEK